MSEFIFKSKNLFLNKKPEINYNIYISNNEKKIKFMIKFFKGFSKKKGYLGIDFEFNRKLDDSGREIALVQINLETETSGNIFLFYPPDLNKDDLNIFKLLLTNKNLIKIIHGGEALDIPYLFDFVLKNDNDRLNFCTNLYDTKYLCEYYNYENKLDNKCKIYDLLKNFKIISITQYNKLLKNEEEMGPIYNIRININKINSNLLKYTVFDVIFLPELFKKFPNNTTYRKIVPELSSLSFILKYDNFFTKNYINDYNIYFIKNLNNLKLIDCFYLYYYGLYDKKNIYDKLLNINYFKKFIEFYIKFIVYNKLIDNYNINKDNNTIIKKKIKFDILNNKNFKNLKKYLDELGNKIKNDIDYYKI